MFAAGRRELRAGGPGFPEPERGIQEISINPNVDYDLNENLTMRFFVQYRKSIPKTSLSYTTTSINGGVTLRFKLN